MRTCGLRPLKKTTSIVLCCPMLTKAVPQAILEGRAPAESGGVAEESEARAGRQGHEVKPVHAAM
eukprot:6091083-Amphidinium_carterae.1